MLILEKEIQNNFAEKQDNVDFDDYNILLDELSRIRKTKEQFSFKNQENSKSMVDLNIKLQIERDLLNQKLLDLERELDNYKNKYFDFKDKFENESEKYTFLSVQFAEKERNLKIVSEQRDHAEKMIFLKQNELKQLITDYDEKIKEHKRLNDKQKFELEKIKTQRLLLRKTIYEFQTSKIIKVEKKETNINKKFNFEKINDFDFEYKKISDLKLKSSNTEELEKTTSLKYRKKAINKKNSQIISSNKKNLTLIDISQKEFKVNTKKEINSHITALDFNEAGDYIFTSSLDKQIRIISSYNLKEKKKISTKNEIKLLKSINKSSFITIDTKNSINLWDVNKLIQIFDPNLDKNTPLISSIAYNNSNLLTIGLENGNINLLDLRTSQIVSEIKVAHNHQIDHIVCYEENKLASGSINNEIFFFDIRKAGVQNLVDLSFMNFKSDSFSFGVGNKCVIGNDVGEIFSYDLIGSCTLEQIVKVCDRDIPFVFYNTSYDHIYAWDIDRSFHYFVSDVKG